MSQPIFTSVGIEDIKDILKVLQKRIYVIYQELKNQIDNEKFISSTECNRPQSNNFIVRWKYNFESIAFDPHRMFRILLCIFHKKIAEQKVNPKVNIV